MILEPAKRAVRQKITEVFNDAGKGERPVRRRAPAPRCGAREGGAGLELLVAAEVTVSAGRSEQGKAAVSVPTGAPGPKCEPPNPQMQPTGRTVPSSARVLIADGDQWNIESCGRGLRACS